MKITPTKELEAKVREELKVGDPEMEEAEGAILKNTSGEKDEAAGGND